MFQCFKNTNINSKMPFDKSLTNDILDSLGEGLFTVDKNFKINFFNRAAEKITGYQREEVLGKYCKQIFRSKLCVEKCPIAQVLEMGKTHFDVSSKIVNKYGQKVPVRLSAAVLRNNHSEEPIGGVISFRDLSELQLLSEKIRNEDSFYGIVGTSKALQEIFMLIEEIADSDASVLIQGESGTGKEMAANAIFATSLRKDKPYIKLNCSVFPPQLLASELFGHVRGAFTGAIKNRVGRFEMANRGTIFLDEIAEMPAQMQVQLLRVLQEGTFERVGESVTRKTDVRVLAATNKNILISIETGSFREDLYYRLNVIPIEIPPLRERPEDIPKLIEYFLKKFSLLSNKTISEIENGAMDLLLNYSWPGNVRELENSLEYAFARTKENTIKTNVLPPIIRMQSGKQKVWKSQTMASHLSSKNNKDEDELINLLEKYHWNRSKVAKELGIGRTTLWRRMKGLKLI